MKKFNDSAAIHFKKLVNGESFKDVKEDIKKSENGKQPVFHVTDEDEASNIWGYEQTILDNIKLVGQVGYSLVFTDTDDVYTVSKGKFNKHELTFLDDVRSTSWNKAYTPEDKADQFEYNAKYGY